MKSRFKIQITMLSMVMAVLLHPLYAPLTALVYPKDLSEAIDSYYQEIDGEGVQKINIQSSDGIITVRGYEGNSIRINAEYKATGKKQKVCRNLLEKIKVETSVETHELKIDLNIKERRRYDIKTFVEICVPVDCDVTANIKHGLIFVYDLNGSADVQTRNGDLSVEKVTGKVTFFAINGNIFLKDVSGEINGLTANGSITCESYELMPSSLDLTSGNGSVRLDLHKNPDADLEANAANGFIHISGIEDVLPNRYIGNYKSKFGTGRGLYELQTLNGSISLNLLSAF